MKSFRIYLLANDVIWVGELANTQDVVHCFHSKQMDLLERFCKQHSDLEMQLEGAFSYWVLCALGRCKKNVNKYGVLIRKLIDFSKKLWKQLLSYAKRTAKEIRLFQKRRKSLMEASVLL